MPEELGPEAHELQEQVHKALEDFEESKLERSEEREQEKKDRQFFNWIGLSTGIISTLAAIAAMQGGYLANEATLAQMKANDQWGLFQAKSTKRHIEQSTAIVLETLQKPIPPKVKAEIVKLRQEQEKSKAEAEKLQAESEENLHRHHLFARSVAALQVSISLSAISVLLRRRIMWYLGLGIALIGVSSMIAGAFPSAEQQGDHPTEQTSK